MIRPPAMDPDVVFAADGILTMTSAPTATVGEKFRPLEWLKQRASAYN